MSSPKASGGPLYSPLCGVDPTAVQRFQLAKHRYSFRARKTLAEGVGHPEGTGYRNGSTRGGTTSSVRNISRRVGQTVRSAFGRAKATTKKRSRRLFKACICQAPEPLSPTILSHIQTKGARAILGGKENVERLIDSRDCKTPAGGRTQGLRRTAEASMYMPTPWDGPQSKAPPRKISPTANTFKPSTEAEKAIFGVVEGSRQSLSSRTPLPVGSPGSQTYEPGSFARKAHSVARTPLQGLPNEAVYSFRSRQAAGLSGVEKSVTRMLQSGGRQRMNRSRTSAAPLSGNRGRDLHTAFASAT